jgi:F-type H+-transporting ATPase subunit b
MLDFSVTFVITVVNIVILTLILRAVLFKPVTKFIADRARRVQESIEQSEKDKEQARALREQFETQLKTAETEAAVILKTAREQAKEEADKIIADSRASVDAMVAGARKKLEMEREAALAEFRKEAAGLVVAATGRLASRELRSEDSRRYAEMLLEEISPDEESSPQGCGDDV